MNTWSGVSLVLCALAYVGFAALVVLLLRQKKGHLDG
jgi:hypothetical protein